MGAGVAFAIAVALTPVIRAVAAALQVVDRPGPRRAHAVSVPRLGGIAIFVAIAGGLLLPGVLGGSSLQLLRSNEWPLEGMLAGATVMLITGIVDDVVGLRPPIKLLAQLFAALLAVASGSGFVAVTNPLGEGIIELGWLGTFLSVAWIVAITNAFNLIDGLDGLAAGVGVIACITIALVAAVEGRADAILVASVIGGALLGFLLYNFHPATIFLGDCGSLVLGYTLSLLAIHGLQKGTTLIVVLVPLLTLGLPIHDTGVTIVRRYLIAGWAAVLRADQEHLHHRLMAIGMTHRAAVLTLYAAGAGLGLLALLMVFAHGAVKALLLAVAAATTWVAMRRLGYHARAAARDRSGTEVIFLHPHLGLGGAERLTVDAACELQARGYRVRLFVLTHDRQRGFAETCDGRLEVIELGSRRGGDSMRAIRTVLAMHRLAFAVARQPRRADIVICDLVPHVIPWLRALIDAPIIYYCHYPDVLLAPLERRGAYGWYRWPIDALELWGLQIADRVLVNSRFTEQQLRATFPSLQRRIEVVSPGAAPPAEEELAGPTSCGEPILLLSLNRFDPNKNLGLALRATAHLRELLEPDLFARVELVIAGGFDEQLPEQRANFAALQRLADELGLAGQVRFRRSISDGERCQLLRQSRVLLYTPVEEHFGLGPVEAMLAGRPVIAVDGGGVRETIVDDETGYLCQPQPEAFAARLAPLVRSAELAHRLGTTARTHALQRFTRARFGDQLDAVVRELIPLRAASDVAMR
ncbi:MAG TPA: glycosyltransferase [Terriglobales bacterium]|nr:glycosyltransferase [Terriglobales bacterium]